MIIEVKGVGQGMNGVNALVAALGGKSSPMNGRGEQGAGASRSRDPAVPGNLKKSSSMDNVPDRMDSGPKGIARTTSDGEEHRMSEAAKKAGGGRGGLSTLPRSNSLNAIASMWAPLRQHPTLRIRRVSGFPRTVSRPLAPEGGIPSARILRNVPLSNSPGSVLQAGSLPPSIPRTAHRGASRSTPWSERAFLHHYPLYSRRRVLFWPSLLHFSPT